MQNHEFAGDRQGAGMSSSSGILALAVSTLLAACGGADGSGAGVTQPPATHTLTLAATVLGTLDPTVEGHYAVWGVAGNGATLQLATFAGGDGRIVTASIPSTDFDRIDVTLEPPGDTDDTPSLRRILTGTIANRRASLSVVGALTVGSAPMRERPGQFTSFSPSDNGLYGYPSHEEAGIWLFNMAPRETEQGDMWVRLAPLREGWVYEGWMVRDIDTPQAIWLSYGKFLPDQAGAVNTRDDTGWGYFSGVPDFRLGEEEFPGDDWIDNIFGHPFPSALTLPLDLRERAPNGGSRWSHVITVEPGTDKGEAIGSERPFVIRPYRDPFGDGGAGVARTITYRAEGVPRAEVTIQ